MRRRRDQADARRRVAHLGDHRVDLVAGQLAALAGLGALRHLDLHHVGIDEIFGRHAEAAGGHLLDRRAHRVAVRQRLEAVGFLAAFAGVRLAADAVHGDGERRVRLAADRAERHGAGREALDDLLAPARPRRAEPAARPSSAAVLMRNRPRMVSSCSRLLVDQLGDRRGTSPRQLPRTACCSATTVCGATYAPRRGCGRHIRRRHRARRARPARRRRRRRGGRRVSSRDLGEADAFDRASPCR